MTSETVKVAAVAMHSEMGDPEVNLKRLEHWAVKAHKEGAAFALFTEECITGSLNKSDLTVDQVHDIAREAQELALPFLERLSHELSMTVVVGTIEPVDGGLKNSAYIVGPEGGVHHPGARPRPGERLAEEPSLIALAVQCHDNHDGGPGHGRRTPPSPG